jgi:hypothetical protein
VSLGRTQSSRVQSKLNREEVRSVQRADEAVLVSRKGWLVSRRCCKASRRGWTCHWTARRRDGKVNSKVVKQLEDTLQKAIL